MLAFSQSRCHQSYTSTHAKTRLPPHKAIPRTPWTDTETDSSLRLTCANRIIKLQGSLQPTILWASSWCHPRLRLRRRWHTALLASPPTGWDWSNWTPLTSLSLSFLARTPPTPQTGFASYASFYSTACLAPSAHIPALNDFLIPNSRAAVRGRRRRRLTPLTHRLKPMPPRPPSIHDDGSATIG